MQAAVAKVYSVVPNEVFRTRVEISSTKLRSLMGLEPGKELHYDLQVRGLGGSCITTYR